MKKRITLRMICAAAWLALLGASLPAAAQTLTPTFASIGVDWKIGVDSKSRCRVEFRAVGETTWRKGLDLFTDLARDEPSNSPFRFNNPETEGFRGSIVMLQPNTRYEVKLTYTIKGGSEQTKVLSTRTWDETFPVDGPEITVTSRKDLQEKLDALKKRGNRPKGQYVVFKGNGTTKIDGGSERHAIEMEDLSYVILRDLEIVGADASGIWISESDHIVIENCRIHDWGEPGPQCKGAGKDAAIYAQSSSHLVVQRNTIRNPRGNSCHWPLRNEHPAGPRGIALTNWANGTNAGVTKSVFRYNKIFSSDQGRYYSDVFNAESGGADSDIDVYGNELANAWDDGVEIEGNNKNIRVWGNVIRNVHNAVASDRVGGREDDRDGYRTYYGPVYIWRNLITNLQAGPNDQGNGQVGPGGKRWEAGAFKIDNRKGQGAIYLFNNTISGLAGSGGSDRFIKPGRGIHNDGQHNVVAKNNIFEIKNETFYDNDMMPSSVLNYNAYSSARSKHKAQLNRENWEANGQFGVNFTYQKGDKEWDYYVQGSGKGAGTSINNFVDPPAGTAVDLGAAQAGVWSMCVGPDANCDNTTNPPPPAEPLPEPEVEPIEAAYVPSTLLLTGYPEGTYWASAPTYTFGHPDGNEVSDNRVSLKTLWTEQALLVGVVVQDDPAVVSSADAAKPFRNDGIELLLDVGNSNAPGWNPSQGHHQIVVDFAGNQLLNPTDWADVTVVRGETNAEHPGHHYVISVPWSSLEVDPRDSPRIGIDVANNDRENDKAKTQFTYTQRTTEFQVPGQFAQLKLGKQAPLQATLARSPITIDGKLDEAAWQVNAAGEVGSYAFGPSFLAQAVARLLWDADNLYVSFQVTDASLGEGGDPAKPWFNNGVEVLLDLENNDAPWSIAQGHRQFIVDIQGNTHRDPDTLAATFDSEVNTSTFGSGYVIELSIPWASLGAVPRAGDVMGIELVHNDRLGDGSWKSRTVTGRTNDSGVTFKLPSAFADVVLVGSTNARTATSDKPTAATLGAEARHLTVYPNPSSAGKAQLKLSGFGEGARVQITDTKGRVVYQGVHHSSRVDLARHFPRGLYIVRVSDGQGTLTQKLLVE